MPTTTKKVVITYHYPIDDEGCHGDFYESDLFIDGKEVLSLSDYYHDKPEEQFQGFLAALKWAKIKYTLKEIRINDSTL